MPPNETRVAKPIDLKTGSTCSYVLAGADGTDTFVVPPQPGGTESLAPAAQVARFQIRERLGSGSYGSVYLAYDPTLDRELALKVPCDAAQWTEIDTQKFLEEARLAARLKHPHVITIYDAGSCPETGVYIAMEYVEGETLAHRLSRGKPGLLEALRMCGQIASAIHEGHKLGLVHRDLKPSNILLDRAGNVKVCDFGLALDEDSQRARRGEVSGTRPYMSPEQIRGNSHLLDGRTDVWSLGVILYECLSGRRPFRGENAADIRDEILTRDPKPLRQIDDAIPSELDVLCRQALQRNLPERLPTALDFQQSILNVERRRGRKSLRTALVMCAVIGALAAAVFAASAIYSRPGEHPVASRAGLLGDSSTPPSGKIDLLGREPRVIIFSDADVNSHYAFNEAARRLVVDSPRWSIFSCGTHPQVIKLDVATSHGNRPGIVGVFWGLHSEPAADGTTEKSCLVAIIEPDSSKPEYAKFSLYNFRLSKNVFGQMGIHATHKIMECTARLDWAAPVDFQVSISHGRPLELSLQAAPVRVPTAELQFDWPAYSTGDCGLVASDQQVVFTRALLETQPGKNPR